VISGHGVCVTASGELPLEPLAGFLIPANCAHHFETAASPLRIVAYHPDSDWGPTHEIHPMINRTVIR
jgi:hypothetical protein